MIRILLYFLAFIMLLSLFGCDLETETVPGDADVEQALQRHYERVESMTDNKVRRLERKIIRFKDNGSLLSEEDELEAESDADSNSDSDLDTHEQSSGEECQDIRIIIDVDNGDTDHEIFRLSCDAMNQAKSSMREGIKSMGDMLESLTSVIENELSYITGLDHASVLACVPALERPGFVCDVDVAFTYSNGQVREQLVTARFVKGRDGWVALDVNKSMN